MAARNPVGRQLFARLWFVRCQLLARLVQAPLMMTPSSFGTPSFSWLSKFLGPNHDTIDQLGPAASVLAAKQARFARNRPPRMPHTEEEKELARQRRLAAHLDAFMSAVSAIPDSTAARRDDISVRHI